MYRPGKVGRAVAMGAADDTSQEAAMKRTTKQEQRRQRFDGVARGLAEAELARVTGGDLYMQNPRGSNAGSGGSGGSGG